MLLPLQHKNTTLLPFFTSGRKEEMRIVFWRDTESYWQWTDSATEAKLLEHYKLGFICFDIKSPLWCLGSTLGVERASPSPTHWAGCLQPWACINLVLAGDLLQGCVGCEQNAAPAVAGKSRRAKNCPTLHWGRSKSLHNPMIIQRVRLWFLPTPLTPNTVKAKLRTTAAESPTHDCFQPHSPNLHQVLYACRHPIYPLIYSVSLRFAAGKRGREIGLSVSSLFNRVCE